MKIIVTGTAGFIGFHLSNKLLALNHKVYGIDNLNNYYDVSLKKKDYYFKKKNFSFFKIDISNKKKLEKIFQKQNQIL